MCVCVCIYMQLFQQVVDKVVKKKRPPNYNVMLHNDDFNVREYVVQVLLKVIPGT